MQVASLDTAELLEGGWREGCLLLVMPGGADLPYCRHLNGRGNSLIRGGPVMIRTPALSSLLDALHPQGLQSQAPPQLGRLFCSLHTCCRVPSHPPACLPACLPGAACLPPTEFVEGGGSYMGLCAGAYYASSHVQFEPGTR